MEPRPHEEYDDYYADQEEYYYYGALTFDAELETAEQRSALYHDILAPYERELLGMDLLELHEHCFSTAASRGLLAEAQAMPATDEDLLHQFETQWLGLDLISSELRRAQRRSSSHCRGCREMESVI